MKTQPAARGACARIGIRLRRLHAQLSSLDNRWEGREPVETMFETLGEVAETFERVRRRGGAPLH